MSTLRFTKDHEWLRTEDDGSVSIGITEYAQEQLGDIVYVELPESGKSVARGELLVVVESVKAVGEVSMPMAGTVAALNERLADEPELVNADAMGQGWLVRFTPEDATELEQLMDEGAYESYVAGL